MKLSIIVPVYNEMNTLPKMLKTLDKVNLPVEKEMILVDDGSEDGSRELLKKLAKKKKYKIILRHKNGGKGTAVRTGFKHATGDIITIQDADLEYNPEDYKKLLKPILKGRTRVVYGSRFKGQSTSSHQRWAIPTHYFGNVFLSFVTSVLYFQWVSDMETCYKMFTKEAFKGIKLRSRAFDLEPEITAKFLRKGEKVMELPISYNPRSFEEGKKIHWHDGFTALWTLLRFRFTP